jgi:hypothetical protein
MLLDIELPSTNQPMFEEVKEYFKYDNVLICNKYLTLNILLETNENINTIRNRINNKFSVTCKCYVAKKQDSKIIINDDGMVSILYNTLYSNEELFKKYKFVGLGGMLNLESIGLYKCDYPTDQDVYNIITSSDDISLKFLGMSNNTARYMVLRHADITKYIKVITVNGTEEVFEVVIRIGGTIVHAQIYNTSNVKINPFVYGIPTIALMNEDLEVYITGNNRNIKVGSNQLYLSRHDRNNLCNNEILFNDSNHIYDGRFYKNDNTPINPHFCNLNTPMASNIEEVRNEQSSEYLCNYPSDPDINNIECGQRTLREYGICSPHGIYKYEIAMERNIISHFTIYGKAKSVKMEIGGQHMMTKSLKPSDIIHTFRPFSFGIPHIEYHMVTIEIESDLYERTASQGITLESVRLVLNEEDISRMFPLERSFIDESTGKEYRFAGGMMSKARMDSSSTSTSTSTRSPTLFVLQD